jgi:hypothetical protein
LYSTIAASPEFPRKSRYFSANSEAGAGFIEMEWNQIGCVIRTVVAGKNPLTGAVLDRTSTSATKWHHRANRPYMDFIEYPIKPKVGGRKRCGRHFCLQVLSC